MKITQPQFLFTIHQLSSINKISHKDNKIIVELIPNKIHLIHEFDDDGINHIFFNVEDKSVELNNIDDLKLILQNELTLELANKLYSKFVSRS